MGIFKSLQRSIDIKKKAKQQDNLINAIETADKTITNIHNQIKAFEQLIAKYEDLAIEAAKIGDDAFADELAETIVDVEDFIKDLRVIASKVEVETYTAIALANLGELTNVLGNLSTLSNYAPDFDRLAEQMAALRRNFGEARRGLKAFRSKVTTNSALSKYFPNAQNDDPERAKRIAKKKDDIVARIVTEEPSIAGADKTKKKTISDDNGIDSIGKMMDEENGKK